MVVRMLQAEPLEAYLASDDVLQADAPDVRALAARLRAGRDDVTFARAAYEWVRDEVAHSVDAQDRRITVTATEVLRDRVGLCFAKSHLLVALLRAEDVPAGLCYQRLADGERHTLHGLVAIHLAGEWHRQDPRGNRAGSIDAQFSVDEERLAWGVDPDAGEISYPQVHQRPAAVVLTALREADDALVLCDGHLPTELSD